MVRKIVGYNFVLPPYVSSTLAALSSAASRPDWQSLEDIDVPLHQHSLLFTIDKTLFQCLISSASSTHVCALAFSSALPHAGD